MYNEYSVYEMGHDEGFSNGRSQHPRTPEILAEDINPPLTQDEQSTFVKGYNDGYKEAEVQTEMTRQKDRSDFIRECG